MLQSLNFKHIFYFWIVAKERSIQKASIMANVSPSSISEQIRTLEARVGVDLFNRSQKKMNLSSPGKVLFEKLDIFFPEIEELFESLSNHKHTEVKILKIGFCPTLSREIRFNLSYGFIEDPYYTVKILQGENSFLTRAFNNDEVDLYFSTNKNISPKGNFKKFKLGIKKFNLVCNSKLFKELEKKRGIEVLNNRRLINFTSDSELHFKIYKILHSENVHPIRVAEIDDINLIKDTIKKFNSFAFLPINSIAEELKQGELKKISFNTHLINSDVHAIYKPSFESERFLNHLKKLKKLLV